MKRKHLYVFTEVTHKYHRGLIDGTKMIDINVLGYDEFGCTIWCDSYELYPESMIKDCLALTVKRLIMLGYTVSDGSPQDRLEKHLYGGM